MKYKRFFQPGGTFFFTVVSNNRRKIFLDENAVLLFEDSVNNVRQNYPFEIVAYCICPDHIHMIWALPENDSDYPTRWRLIKSRFSHQFIDKTQVILPKSRNRKNEKGIWQRRYWEHYLKNEGDLKNHIEYIHFNPVKHKLASSPLEWKFSSFIRYVNEGLYSENWGANGNMDYLNKIGNE